MGILQEGILQARVLRRLPCLPSGDLPNPGIEPRAPTLRTDPGKPPQNMERLMNFCVIIISSVQFSCSVASDSLRPHGLKHIRLPITNSWSLFKCMSIESLMPPHPLSSTSPPAFNLSQQQGLFQWVSSSHQVAKVLDQGKIVQVQNSTRPGQNSTKRIWPCIARPHIFLLFKSLFCYNHKFIAIQSLIQVQLFATAWTAACQASPSFTISWSLLKLMSIKSMVLSNHLFLCCAFSSCPQSFPAPRSFLMSRLFESGGQRIRTSASVLPINIQSWFPLRLTGLIFLLSKEFSRAFFSTTV